MRHLEVLWVSRCGLRDLDGFAALPSLKELYAAFNDISDLSPLAGSDSLEILDMETNAVAHLSQLDNLGCCERLSSATLDGNGVAR